VPHALRQFIIPEDRVVLGEVIGHGAYGIVFKGSLGNRSVCVKVSDLSVSAFKLFVKRIVMLGVCVCIVQAYHALQQPDLYYITAGTSIYQRVVNELYDEASLLAIIHHERIVSFQGICLDSSGWPKYVLTELGLGNMKQYLQQLARQLTVDELHSYSVDIFSGLSYLHELEPRSIVHRDLKPDNIIAFSTHSCGVVMKIGDVGLARFISASRTAQSVAGSMFYMSPEVALSQPYDGRADVFSVGVTLCEVVVCVMAEGSQHTFSPHPSNRSVMVHEASMLLRGNPDPMAARLADVLEMCTEQDANQRLTSRQMLDLLVGQPVRVACDD
jgi:serine/threonine protein kinase